MQTRSWLWIAAGIFLLSACKKKPAASACTDRDGIYKFADYPIGVAVNADSLWSGNLYTQKVAAQFNSVTPENIFKPSFLHPGEQQFSWLQADRFADFFSSTGKRIHGHTLIWHNQLPAWMENYEGSPDQWEQLFKTHIQTIVSHFKGKVHSWDVVNEAFNEDGTLRETIWKQHIGSGYIEKAFRYAHEADPDALLFYNDYFLETDPTKRKAVLSYFNNLKARGFKIDGIGLQCHVSTFYPDMSQIADAFRDVADNRYLLHVSELDISVNPFYKDITPDDALFNRQAEIMGAIVLHYNQVPPEYRYGITLWGLHDSKTGVWPYYGREDYPWIYDGDYKPKPAYCKLKELL